uniref:Protein RFT1 homolog n=1 Tax=Ditylum brightwellii TaxID=49249 RepID=A0A7S1Z403_9STRA
MLSFFLRLLSFGLNQITIRFVNPQTLGKASIQLDLLLNTCLFLSREGFRLSLTNSSSSSSSSSQGGTKIKEEMEAQQRSVNVSWLTIPTGLLLSLLTLAFHLHQCSSSTTNNVNNDFRTAGILYILASFIETLSEPLLISCLQTLDVASRASAEGMATTVKAVTCVFTLKVLDRIDSSSSDAWSVTAFGIAQLSYAITLTATLYYRKWNVIQYPRFIPPPSQHNKSFLHDNFHLPTLNLTFLFSLQSIFKHCLTEGDKIVLTALSDSYDQGIYAMTLSYGSIICRCIFQPLEENARLLFARQYVLVKQQQQNHHLSKKQHQYEHLQHLHDTYTALVKLVLCIGCLFTFLGTNYTSVLLHVLAGSKWSSSSSSLSSSYQNTASSSLSAFCVYISTLAFNGTTEAFVYGVVDKPKDVGTLGIIHGCVGVLFAITVPIAVKMYGTIGLILGNGICMIIRGTFAVYLAACFFREHTTISTTNNDDATNQKQEDDKGTTAKKDAQSNSNLPINTQKSTITNIMTNMIKNMFLHPIVLMGFISCFIITRYSLHFHFQQLSTNDNHGYIHKGWIVAALSHILVGITSLVLFVMIPMYKYEGSFGRYLSSMLKEKKMKHDDDDGRKNGHQKME